jgi:hypothetical protein
MKDGAAFGLGIISGLTGSLAFDKITNNKDTTTMNG